LNLLQVKLEFSSFSERKPLCGRYPDHCGFAGVADIEKRFVTELLRDIDRESDGLAIQMVLLGVLQTP
jgi:hypothetical protein